MNSWMAVENLIKYLITTHLWKPYFINLPMKTLSAKVCRGYKIFDACYQMALIPSMHDSKPCCLRATSSQWNQPYLSQHKLDVGSENCNMSRSVTFNKIALFVGLSPWTINYWYKKNRAAFTKHPTHLLNSYCYVSYCISSGCSLAKLCCWEPWINIQLQEWLFEAWQGTFNWLRSGCFVSLLHL